MDSEQETRRPFVIPDVSRIKMPNAGPDYISNGNTRGRDIFGRMAFNTGIFWLGGFGLFGIAGAAQGWRSAVNPSFKVRLNSVMNGFSKSGSKYGNALGIIACIHTATVGVSDSIDLEEHASKVGIGEFVTPLVAGVVTGGLFTMNNTSGRAKGLAVVIGGAVSVAYWYGLAFVSESVSSKGGKF